MKNQPKHQRSRGEELHFIRPIILGGNPEDEDNVTFLSRPQHIQAVRYWNKILNDLKTQRAKQDREV
jgi:ABC-type glycerol-3-phosphate transport system substrate-binding protein